MSATQAKDASKQVQDAHCIVAFYDARWFKDRTRHHFDNAATGASAQSAIDASSRKANEDYRAHVLTTEAKNTAVVEEDRLNEELDDEQQSLSNVELKDLFAPKERALLVGTHSKDWAGVLSLLDQSPASDNFVECAIGIHPWFVSLDMNDHREDIAMVEASLKRYARLRIGEIGLDKFDTRNQSTFDNQLCLFETFIDLAGRYKRSVSIHCVRAHGALFHSLTALNKDKSRPIPKGVFLHSFNASPEIAKALLSMNRIGKIVYFGFSFKHNANRRDLMEVIPMDRMLVESDTAIDKQQERIKGLENMREALKEFVSEEQLGANFETFLRLMTEED